MSTNAYYSEQHIYFDCNTPSIYYGFIISTTGDFTSFEDIDSKEQRDNIVSKVAEIFPMAQYQMLVAAMIYFRVRGHADWLDEEEYARALEPYAIEDVDYDYWEKLIDGKQEPGENQ